MKTALAQFDSMRNTFLTTLFTTLLFASFGVANASNPVATGMELQLAADGTPETLDNLTGQGKWTLVMIWATNCHACMEQKPEISAFHNKYKDTNAHVIGIALDGIDRADAVNRYVEKYQVSFPSYVGNSAIIASHYQGMTEENLYGTPTYLLFNPEGELLGSNPGQLTVQAIEDFIARKS